MIQTFSEAIKLHNGTFYNLPYHQARIDKTQINFGGDKIVLAEALNVIPPEAQSGLFKCRVVYDKQIKEIEFLPYTVCQIRSVSVIVDNEITYRFKSTDRTRLETLMKSTASDDIIIIKKGFVTDAVASNLVFESEKGLFTPDSCLLKGTKRQFLLDTKRIREEKIALDDIQRYHRIYFINAMIDLEDMVCIDVSKIDL